MEVKGTAVSTIGKFVKKNFPESYKTWLNKLPEESRRLFDEGIYTNEWYPMDTACVLPTRYIGDIFYNGDRQKAAWDNGRYSADAALRGIYWFYVKVGSPQHIISRGARIFAAYYSPSELVVEDLHNYSLKVVIKKFESPDKIVEARIGGWIERALEISGCKNVQVNITQSLTKADKVTRYDVQWNYSG